MEVAAVAQPDGEAAAVGPTSGEVAAASSSTTDAVGPSLEGASEVERRRSMAASSLQALQEAQCSKTLTLTLDWAKGEQ